MISFYGVGTVIGRIACGLALDKYPAPPVAFISMVLPALGYAILASPYDTPAAIGFAMLLVGIMVGAEGDLLSYLVARHFKLNIFSTTLSLVYFSVYLAAAVGSLGISVTLNLFDSFAPYLAMMVVTSIVGSAMFLLLPKAGRFEKIG
jgi:predicted MFS family arabinose efflux permease